MTRPVWHEGEIALQESLGIAARMQEIGGRVIRDYMIDQHRSFYGLLPFVVLGTVDRSGDAWTTLRAGAPGFLDSPDSHHLHVAMQPDPDDPAEAGLGDGAAIGLLGIDLATRRRNRLNGRIRRAAPNGFDVVVEHSFGNCPRYIHTRSTHFREEPSAAAAAPVIAQGLDADARSLIAAADTFFVASYAHPKGHDRQIDVSHRGGPPGFVHIADDATLTIPDYAGNFFFNTLGNLLVNPRAGLVFVDFATGDLLQLTGDADILPVPPDAEQFAGAERLWRFAPRRVLLRENALSLRFSNPAGASAAAVG